MGGVVREGSLRHDGVSGAAEGGGGRPSTRSAAARRGRSREGSALCSESGVGLGEGAGSAAVRGGLEVRGRKPGTKSGNLCEG